MNHSGPGWLIDGCPASRAAPGGDLRDSPRNGYVRTTTPPGCRPVSQPCPFHATMTDLLRQEIATAADIVVVKVGTRVLTTPEGTLNKARYRERWPKRFTRSSTRDERWSSSVSARSAPAWAGSACGNGRAIWLSFRPSPRWGKATSSRSMTVRSAPFGRHAAKSC